MKIQELIDKILNWTEKANKWKFRPYQRKSSEQIIRVAIVDSPTILTRLWSRKAGKTHTLRIIMSALMSILPSLAHTYLAKEYPRLKLYKFGLNLAFAGPKENLAKLPFKDLRRQAREKHFLEYLRQLEVSVHASNSETFELSNGSIATAFSGSETAANEGYGAQVLILDESQRLSPFSTYKILYPMVAHCDGPIISIGTPARRKCPFLTNIEYNQRKFPDYHQEIPYTGVIPFSKWYASYIDKEIDRLPGGVDNPAFKMNFLLEWLIAEGHFVDPNVFIKLNTGQKGAIGGRLAAGIDWGKVDSSTTATILEDRGDRKAVIGLFEIKGNWEHQFDYLVPFLKSFPNLRLIYSESNPMGDMPTEKLMGEFPGKVEGRYMTAPYKDQIFTKLQAEITATHPRFEYYEDKSKESQNFIRQFLDAEQEMKGNLLSVHKPDEEGAADDFLVSTALANAAIESIPSGKVEYRSTGKKRDVLSALENF